MSPLRILAVEILGLLAAAFIIAAIIFAKMAKRGDQEIDKILGTGTKHENGISPKNKG